MHSADAPVTPRHRRPGPVAEGLLAFLLGLLLAVLVRRPQDLMTTVPGQARDPVLLSWQLSWPGHALTSSDSLYDGNVFAPVERSFAFTDLLLGYLPFSLLGRGPEAALLRYNVVLLFAMALAFAGTWVLVRQLGLGRAAALLAATAFAFNPWRASQLQHVQVLSSGGIPLALALLARGHGIGRRTGLREVRPAWAFAGWAVAAWHVSIGFGLGLQLAYLLGVCTAVAAVRALLLQRRGGGWPDRRLLGADAAGIALFLALSGVLALPYFAIVEDHPQSRRSVAELQEFSPSATALVTAPAESWAWGRYSEDERKDVGAVQEKALFPGFVALAMGAVGLLLPGAWSRRRVAMVAGATVVIALFALGTSGPAGGRWTYLLLYEHAPGWQGVRTPSRLVTTAWLGLALLAAHGVTVLQRAMRGTSRTVDAPAFSGLAVVLTALALVEGLDTAGLTTIRTPPTGVRLADLPEPVMVLPSEDFVDQDVMLWSTDGYPAVVNGVSGFTPQEQAELRDAAARLPAPDALDRLRRSGVATLVLLPELTPGTRYEPVTAASLSLLPGVLVEARGDAVVVRLQP